MKKTLSFVLAFVLSMQPCLATLVSKPFTFTPGTTIYSSQVNTDFDTLYSVINGNLDNTNIGAAGIYASQIIPTTSGQATFGGSQTYTFPNGISVPTGKSVAGDIVNKVYNVKTYGAVGNGSTNDTAAIQAAITAAIATGGIVYFPPGQYKITSALTIDLTAALAGGIVVQGSGRGRRGSTLGSIIEPSSTTADVFVIKQSQSNGQGGVHFHDFGIDHSILGSNPTAGNDFNFSSASASSAVADDEISSVSSFQPHNFVQVGWTGAGAGNVDGGLNVHDFSAESTQNACLKITGSTGSAGGLTVHHGYCAGVNGASVCIQIQGLASDRVIDPMNIDTLDCESYGLGYIQDSGNVSDSTFNNLILDGVATGPGFKVSSGATFHNIRIYDSWFTTAANQALVLSSNGVAGNIHGVTIEGTYFQAGTLDSVFVGDGTQYVDFIGDHAGFSAGCGLKIGGSSTTRNINIVGGGYDNLYNVGGAPNNQGICIAPGGGGTVDHSLISGVDLTGNTSNALVLDYTNTLTNLTVVGNDMKGYATPVAITGTESGSTKFSANNGYQFETSTSASGVDGWTFNRLGTASTDNVASFQFQGTQQAAVLGNGKLTALGPIISGPGGGLSLSAGDVGASRSTTTGAFSLGGSGSSCTLDYGVTTSSTLTSSCALVAPTIAKVYAAASQLATSPHFESFTGSINNQTLTLNFGASYAASPICTVSVGTSGHTASINAVATTTVAINDAASDTYYVICMGQ